MMSEEEMFSDLLGRPTTAIAFAFSQRLAQIRPDSFVLESAGGPFNLAEFAKGEHCEISLSDDMHSQLVTSWQDPGAMCTQPRSAWFCVQWQGHKLDVVVATWPAGFGNESWTWVISETEASAKSFFDVASTYCHELREEVLVFNEGCWQKSPRLFRAISGTHLDSLVLEPGLSNEILRDCKQFFDSREVYSEYGLPWKRGVLFLGPPGNGKTHCVKGLINALEQPCLYVQSFKSEYGSTEQGNMEKVFHRARHTTPCILVLEDLDSLLNEGNRSFFLNELDGFEDNNGILTLATTNYPERLDPSIIERPSRFDMKYNFGLPAESERLTYLEKWAEGLDEAARLDATTIKEIARATDNFSFAYLQELCVSSLVRWFHHRDGQIGPFLHEQLQKLRAQMSTEASKTAEKGDSECSE